MGREFLITLKEDKLVHKLENEVITYHNAMNKLSITVLGFLFQLPHLHLDLSISFLSPSFCRQRNHYT